MERSMRYLATLAAAVLLAACGALPTLPPTRGADFGVAETWTVGETRTYGDGLAITLERIDDSRCRPGVQCVWAGELAPVLLLRGGGLAGPRTVSLGTARTPRAQVDEYGVTLVAATEATATLTVDRGGGGTTSDLIRVESPVAGQAVGNPLAVRGSARGAWYHEATFPVTLLDGNGRRLAQSYATAQGDWMTSNWVPFTATLAFAAPATADGTLVVDNANASGDPARALSVRIPVRFATAAGGGTGVRGIAHVGPTCPVETAPRDPACADRAYAGAFVVESVGGIRIAEVSSGSDGRYSLALPPGSYRIRLRDANTLPSLSPQPFTVRDGWTTLDLALDSGIR